MYLETIHVLSQSNEHVRSIDLYVYISRKTVYRLVRQGRLPHTRIGRHIRVSKRALDATLAQGIAR